MNYIDYKNRVTELRVMLNKYFHENNVSDEWAARLLNEMMFSYQVKFPSND